jgi:hypothetical protein
MLSLDERSQAMKLIITNRSEEIVTVGWMVVRLIKNHWVEIVTVVWVGCAIAFAVAYVDAKLPDKENLLGGYNAGVLVPVLENGDRVTLIA